MKILWPDRITAITAESEATGYDIEHVLNRWPGAVWKSNGSKVIEITAQAATCLYVGYTDYSGNINYEMYLDSVLVESGSISPITDENGMSHFWAEIGREGETLIDSEGQTLIDSEGETLLAQNTSDMISLSFPSATSDILIGIIRAGDLNIFQGIHSVDEGISSHSIETELMNNGSRYSVNRAEVSAYNCELLTGNTNGVCNLVRLSRSIKTSDFGCVLVENPARIFFGHFDGRPNASKEYPLYNVTTFSIIEAT